MYLEWQIIGRRRRQIGNCRSRWERSYIVGHRRHIGNSPSNRSRLFYLPSSHIGVPTTIKLPTFKIKANHDIFADSGRILIYFITEKIETNFSRILLFCFQNILLLFHGLPAFETPSCKGNTWIILPLISIFNLQTV